MIRYLIKNYLKLMYRNPVNLLLFTAAPLVLVAVLSSAFSSLMKSYERQDSFTVGYRIEAQSEAESYIELLKEICDENKITLKEFTDGKADELVKDEDLAAFIEFSDDEYVMSKRTDMETECRITEYILTAYLRNVDSYKLAMATGSELKDVDLDISYPDHMPVVDSTDYYGKVEIVYFLWCGIICASFILFEEKRYKIPEKYRVSGLSELQIYLVKCIPTIVSVTVGTLLAMLLSVVLFGVKWGSPLVSVGLIVLMVIAAITFEVMIYYIFNNLVVTIMLSFAIVWIAGFFGGSFETYLFAEHPMAMKLWSPLYHGNRALVELASVGKSDYVMSSVLFLTAITVVSALVSIVVGNTRRKTC